MPQKIIAIQPTQMIVVSGCSGAGKSTLLAEMASRGHRVRNEAGRQIVKEQLQIGGDALPWKNVSQFVELAASRAALQFKSSMIEKSPVLFDRSVVDVVSYLDFRGIETPAHLYRMQEVYRYEPTVFMTPPWREIFQSDSERRKDFDEAEAEYQALVSAYRHLDYQITEIPRSDVQERADFLETCIAACGTVPE
jgi:predicted ATPase